jgi:hypothetical protein
MASNFYAVFSLALAASALSLVAANAACGGDGESTGGGAQDFTAGGATADPAPSGSVDLLHAGVDSLKPGDRCKEDISCTSRGCTRAGSASDLHATGETDLFLQCVAAADGVGTCCVPAGSKPTNGDALLCCSSFEVNAEGLCCLRKGGRPSGTFPNFKASDCCSGTLDSNGFCTDSAPNPKPAGAGCYFDTDCSSGTCDRPCGKAAEPMPDLPGRCH